MNTFHTINTAGLWVLVVGWFAVGAIITAMVASHVNIRTAQREYDRGVRDARNQA